jgi:hypothetical protein
MTGIVFFRSPNYESIASFYVDEVGAEEWLRQSGCRILSYDNLLFGFCASEEPDTDGMLTFVTEDRSGVDAFYEQFTDRATGEPSVNKEYDIYQFFAADPEGRMMEFQTFLHETEPVL